MYIALAETIAINRARRYPQRNFFKSRKIAYMSQRMLFAAFRSFVDVCILSDRTRHYQPHGCGGYLLTYDMHIHRPVSRISIYIINISYIKCRFARLSHAERLHRVIKLCNEVLWRLYVINNASGE